MNRVIIAQSFGHLLQKLTSIDCLTRDQSGFTNQKTLLQLKDYALAVSQYKQKKKQYLKCLHWIEICNRFSNKLV